MTRQVSPSDVGGNEALSTGGLLTRRTGLLGTVLAGVLTAASAALMSVPAGAATPVVQGCVGTTLAPLAQTQPAPGAFGHSVEGNARAAPLFGFHGLGPGIQFLQAGQIPDSELPNTC